MSDVTLTYEMFTYMQAFHPVNAKDDTYYMFGRMRDMEKTLLVVNSKTSKHAYCCEEHKFIFPIRGGHCEMCVPAAQAEPEPAAQTQGAE